MHKKSLETDALQFRSLGRKPYDLIAPFYNHIMQKVNYKNWAEYIYHVIRYTDIRVDSVLEVAAGNGRLSHYLAEYFDDSIITDISQPMIREKQYGSQLRVCCDMSALPFKKAFSVVFSTFDSVNYLLEEARVISFFQEVCRLLSAEGVFTFDASLERNSLLHSAQMRKERQLKGLRYLQESMYDAAKRIHSNIFTISYADGSIVEELHEQRIYPFEFYFEALDEAGLYVEECFDGFSFEDGDASSERVQFIVRKQ